MWQRTMTYQPFRLSLAVGLALACAMTPAHAVPPQTTGGGSAVAPGAAPVTKRKLSPEDILDWKSIRGATLSPNGQWFAYVVTSTDGHSNSVFRKLSDGRELRFESGSLPDTTITFSEDGKSAVFGKWTESSRTISLVNLASGEAKEFERVRTHSFNGRRSSWLALLTQSSQDVAVLELNLHEIATGQVRKVSNVSDFVFDTTGDRLFYTATAADQSVNTIVVRNMVSGLTKTLDSARAIYRFLSLDNGDRGFLSAVRVGRDAATGDSTTAFVWFTDLSAAAPRRQIFEPRTDATFPRGMKVNSAIAPSFTTDRAGIYFSMLPLTSSATRVESAATSGSGATAGGGSPQSNLVIWHYRDSPAVRNQQSAGAGAMDAGFLMLYWHQQKKLLQLEDSVFRTVVRTPKDRWALAVDSRARELPGGAAGADRRDLHVIDLKTGQKRMALAGMQGSVSPSPDGQRFFFFTDGHYYIFELATGNSRNITENVAAFAVKSAADLTLNDDTRHTVGWSADSKFLLISDGWDVWKIAANGSGAVNLTVNGRRDSIRYSAPLFVGAVEGDGAGIDLRKPLYLKAHGEWTKKEGVARVDPAKGGATMWLWEDAALQIARARDVDVFYYKRGTAVQFPDYYISNAPLAAGVRITRANQQQDEVEWSPGVRLVDYKSAKGARLQGALYLPAGYEAGKSYPTVVVVDEKLSHKLHSYTSPGEPLPFNSTVYTSRGYAVFLPDIVYTLNDPGISAVECIVPAVEAAIATGIVDKDHIGLFGEGWGGYESAFLITQTKLFAAAVAAAPLTNLVSIYSSGIASGSRLKATIGGASAGRFTSGYWENYDAWVRNSPVFHPTKVETPLLIEHDGRAGGADFGQSVEFYNVLRALGKPVVLLQYTAASDAAARDANQKDYALKMLEFFEHHLKSAPAPAWWTSGR